MESWSTRDCLIRGAGWWGVLALVTKTIGFEGFHSDGGDSQQTFGWLKSNMASYRQSNPGHSCSLLRMTSGIGQTNQRQSVTGPGTHQCRGNHLKELRLEVVWAVVPVLWLSLWSCGIRAWQRAVRTGGLLQGSDGIGGQRKSSDNIYLDLCTAAVMVPHHILISKLEIRIWRMEYSVDKELVGMSQLEGCGQWLYVQVTVSDK